MDIHGMDALEQVLLRLGRCEEAAEDCLQVWAANGMRTASSTGQLPNLENDVPQVLPFGLEWLDCGLPNYDMGF